MKERPIIFSAPMVRALLDGKKTQTRRAVKPQPVDPYTGRELPAGAWPDALPSCPYGVLGDRLWVRETFASYREDGPSRPATASYVVLPDGTQVYRSGETYAPLPEYAPGSSDGIKWRPSIHMPRWASRIVLELTSVRVERLHAITPADAIAEGVSGLAAYRPLWDAINGAGAWRLNPWVWVLGLRRVTP